MSDPRPIALFGGSFNPPHVVHALVCFYLLQTGCREVWLLPTYKHAFSKSLQPFEARVKMCERLLEPLGERGRVCTIEAEKDETSYTIDTVRLLKARYPGQAFQWVVGSDILDELHLWKDGDELKRIVDFRVLYRTGYQNPAAEVAFPALSSTLIRERLAAGADVSALVPASVLDYIFEHGLYSKGDLHSEMAEG